MLPDLIAGTCLQIDIPDWLVFLYRVVVSAIKWLTTEIPNDGQAVASLVFALNAGFATIDSFTQGIMRSLKESLQRRLDKYNGEWENPVGSENTGVNLKLREEVNNLAEEVVAIQSTLPSVFGKIALHWKIIMGLSAATCLILMAIPYCARFILVLALPVPLFAWCCQRKKDKIKAQILEIDEEYKQLEIESRPSEKTSNIGMSEVFEKLQKAFSALSSDEGIIEKSSTPRKKKTRPKKK